VTESEILSRTAQAFGIESWPVAALKCYLGHSLGAASGDQVTATLGIWQHGILPGIATVEDFADDVRMDNLAMSTTHREIDPGQSAYAIVNSKGFGGNNASATLLSPGTTQNMLRARYSSAEWSAWEKANEPVREAQHAYDQRMIDGTEQPVYRFDHGVLLDGDVDMGPRQMNVGGQVVSLDLCSPYDDMKID
jgi:acetoacetyl-[acyl-carrier protein] synthase